MGVAPWIQIDGLEGSKILLQGGVELKEDGDEALGLKSLKKEFGHGSA